MRQSILKVQNELWASGEEKKCEEIEKVSNGESPWLIYKTTDYSGYFIEALFYLSQVLGFDREIKISDLIDYLYDKYGKIPVMDLMGPGYALTSMKNIHGVGVTLKKHAIIQHDDISTWELNIYDPSEVLFIQNNFANKKLRVLMCRPVEPFNFMQRSFKNPIDYMKRKYISIYFYKRLEELIGLMDVTEFYMFLQIPLVVSRFMYEENIHELLIKHFQKRSIHISFFGYDKERVLIYKC